MFRERSVAGWTALTVLALALSGCAPEGQPPSSGLQTADISSSARPAGQTSKSDTAYGGFLAGGLALRRQNVFEAAEFFGRALSLDPESALLRDRQFVALLASGRVGEALQLAPGIPSSGDAWPIAQLALAVEALRKGDLKDAGEYAAQIPPKSLGGTMAPLLQAWLQVGRGEYDAALASLDRLKNPHLAQFLQLQAAFVSDIADRPDEARKHYEAVIIPRTTRKVQALGRHYIRTNDAGKARKLYEEALSENPNWEVVERELNRIALGEAPPLLIGNAAEGVAETLLEYDRTTRFSRGFLVPLMLLRLAVWLRPDFDEARFRVAGYLRLMDQHDPAISTYREIGEDSLYRRTARLRIANVLESQEKHGEAVEILSAMAAAEPERYEALTALGDLYRRKEEFAKALEFYDRAFEVVGQTEKRHWSLHYFRGIALERLDLWERAEKEFLKALEFVPDDPDVLNYLGYTWVDKGVNLEKALEMIERAVNAQPRSGYIVDSLGWAHYRLGNYEDAIKHLEKAVVLRPHDPIINDHLGDAYWRIGRRNEAGFQWKRALTLDPEPDMIGAIEEKLRSGLTDVAPAGKDKPSQAE